MPKQPVIRAFFDEPTNTVSYLVADPVTRQAAVIDPVLDYDHKSGEVDTRSVETILKAAKDLGLTVVWVLETHAHADHLSGAPYIKAKTGAKIGIGEHIKDVQRIFRPIFNAIDLKTDGSDFDQGAWPRQLCLGDHCSRPAGQECPCRRQQGRSGVRRDAHLSRRHTIGTDAALAINTGQHPRRCVSAGGGQRGALFANPGDLQGKSQGSPLAFLIPHDRYMPI